MQAALKIVYSYDDDDGGFSSLARFELTLLFTQLTQRFTNLRVIEAPDIEPNIFVGAVRSLTMGFTPR